jgi:hypothetical protein
MSTTLYHLLISKHFQTDNSGRTPLMAAALSGADKTVKLLLAYGADPDLMDIQDHTALIAAIIGGVNTTVSILAPVTKAGLGETLVFLARYPHLIEVTQPLKNFVHRCTEDMEAVEIGLHHASYFGAVDLFNLLSECFSKERLTSLLTIRFPSRPLEPPFSHYSFISYTVMSDCPETCGAVLKFTDTVPEDVIEMAEQRGNTRIIEMLTNGSVSKKKDVKQSLKKAVVNKTAGILDLIPRFVEYEFEDKMGKILSLLTQKTVTYSTLLEKLHVPQVHSKNKCP